MREADDIGRQVKKMWRKHHSMYNGYCSCGREHPCPDRVAADNAAAYFGVRGD